METTEMMKAIKADINEYSQKELSDTSAQLEEFAIKANSAGNAMNAFLRLLTE